MIDLDIQWLGRKDYKEVWDSQKELITRIAEHKSNETVILVEHNPVITLGRTGNIKNLLLSEEYLKNRGIEFFRIERGGDITYHGPGQLVGYPLLNLKRLNLSLSEYLRELEQLIIDLLSSFGITSYREPAYTGVWCDQGKLCAIGIAAKRFITFHGFALNVNTNLKDFAVINPCGITDKPVTSMQAVLNKPLQLEEVVERIIPLILKRFS